METGSVITPDEEQALDLLDDNPVAQRYDAENGIDTLKRHEHTRRLSLYLTARGNERIAFSG